MRQAIITATRTYHKQVSVTIQIPMDLDYNDISDFLYSNPAMYDCHLEDRFESAPLEADIEGDDLRYDVEEVVTLKSIVWGGTL